MALDDRAAARLAQIERQLAREEPELAQAMHRWRAPDVRRRPRRSSTRIAVLGVGLSLLALLLGSAAWCTLLVIVTASGWCLARGLERGTHPARRG